MFLLLNHHILLACCLTREVCLWFEVTDRVVSDILGAHHDLALLCLHLTQRDESLDSLSLMVHVPSMLFDVKFLYSCVDRLIQVVLQDYGLLAYVLW